MKLYYAKLIVKNEPTEGDIYNSRRITYFDIDQKKKKIVLYIYKQKFENIKKLNHFEDGEKLMYYFEYMFGEREREREFTLSTQEEDSNTGQENPT